MQPQIIAALLSLSVFLLLWIIDEFGYLLLDPSTQCHARSPGSPGFPS
jgi:hypothetical protein